MNAWPGSSSIRSRKRTGLWHSSRTSTVRGGYTQTSISAGQAVSRVSGLQKSYFFFIRPSVTYYGMYAAGRRAMALRKCWVETLPHGEGVLCIHGVREALQDHVPQPHLTGDLSLPGAVLGAITLLEAGFGNIPTGICKGVERAP